MTPTLTCTYCGTDLGDTTDHGPGDTVGCPDCPASFYLRRESALHDLAVFVCPYCDHRNKRSQGVDSVRCENEDCNLVFDPVGADVVSHDPDVDGDRIKMVPAGGDA